MDLICRSIRVHAENWRTCSISSIVIWPTPWAGKMNQILRCDWLPERARWSYLTRSGLPAVSRKKNIPDNHIINPLLTKLFGQDGWILASFFFCEFTDFDSVSVHEHAKKELGQYPAILTSHLVNNPYILNTQTRQILHIIRLSTDISRCQFANKPERLKWQRSGGHFGWQQQCHPTSWRWQIKIDRRLEE